MFVSLHTVGGVMMSRKHSSRVYVTVDIVAGDSVRISEAFDEFNTFVHEGFMYLHDVNSVAFKEIPKLFSVVSGSVVGGLDE